jgi:hypothetical protein
MATKNLEKKWNEALDNAFQKFIKENVGLKEIKKEEVTKKVKGPSRGPACYGTGDGKSYCRTCRFYAAC